MSVPFYEAFTTAYAKQYTVFGSTAQYYTLSHNENVDNLDNWFTYSGYEVLGQDYATRLQNIPLTNIVYSSLAKEWNTRTLVGNVTTGEANLPIVANYRFYGVYPATKKQVSDFTLRFASLMGDAKKVEAKKEFTSNNVTREVVLTDADFTLVDALDDTFYLFHQRDTRVPCPFGEPFGWDLATTKDFVTYEDCGVAIPRGTDEEQDQFIFAGSICEDREGKYHAFYTGYNRDYPKQGKPSQVLMHAVSEDLKHWTKTQDAVTFVPQPGYDPDDWRDPFVLWDDESEKYILILGARLELSLIHI